MRKTPAGISIVLLASFLGSGTALAADADAFAKRLKEVLEQQGAPFAYGQASSQGENVTLTDVMVGEGENRTPLGDLTFENVSGSDQEGWTAERLPIEDVTGTDRSQGADETFDYAAREMSVENIRIAPTSSDAAQSIPLYFERASIGSLDVTRNGQPAFSMEDGLATNEIADDGSFTGTASVPNFTINVPQQSPDGSADAVRELGYEEFSGSMESNLSYKPDQGTASLSPLTIDVDNVGQLQTSFEMSGYTPELIQSLQQISQQMQENPQSSQGAGMAMMGVLAQLQIDGVSLAFDDDSLTKRIIDYQAEQMNQSPEQVVDLAVQIVGNAISSIGDEAFRNQVTGAVRSFLESPQSIQVASDPERPIPVMQIFGAAMGAPQTLPQVLQLEVEANQ